MWLLSHCSIVLTSPLLAEPMAYIVNHSLCHVLSVCIKGCRCNSYTQIRRVRYMQQLYTYLLALQHQRILARSMHSRIHQFLKKFQMIYGVAFGFRKQHATNHALLHLTTNKQDTFGAGKYSCGLCFGLQDSFDTVSRNIPLRKLECNRTWAISRVSCYLTICRHAICIPRRSIRDTNSTIRPPLLCKQRYHSALCRRHWYFI